VGEHCIDADGASWDARSTLSGDHMPAVTTYSPLGDPYIDGILTGAKWSTATLTYSFPSYGWYYEAGYGKGEPTNNFEALTATQRAAVEKMLQNYSAVSNLTFQTVSESASSHGTLRYAESDALWSAGSYRPGAASESAGDIWLNNSRNIYETPVPGNYAYATLLHETGHALGLKHPDVVWGAFGAMPDNFDSGEYSVMSLRAYAGAPATGYLSSPISYQQTLMMLDIAALQAMYGANYSTNSDNTVYKWSPTTGEMFLNGVGQGAPAGNKIALTIWDGGGSDTYDLSNYQSAVRIDLEPGHWTTTSLVQLADLGNGHYARGNVANALLYNDNPASLIENAIGGPAADTLIGNDADNGLTGGMGNDVLDGSLGLDTAVFTGAYSNYDLTQNVDGSWTIVDGRSGAPDGTDILRNIELVQFTDRTVSLGALPPISLPLNVAPTITGSTGSSGVVTEWLDLSANETSNVPHTFLGTVTYADSDTLDSHVITIMPKGQGYLGTCSLVTNTDTTTGGTIAWSLVVSDRALDPLSAGQVKTQLYDIVIDDGHGGVVVQTITINLQGTSDSSSTRTRGTTNTFDSRSYDDGVHHGVHHHDYTMELLGNHGSLSEFALY
jgi:hypothetical protein